MRTRYATAAIAAFMMWLPGVALAQEASDEWQFNLTPYLWLPTIEGGVNFELPPGGGGSPSFDLGPTDWLDMLNFGALVAGTARKGPFSISTDLVYLSMTKNGDARVASVEGAITGPGGRIEIPVGAELTLDGRTDLDGLQWSLIFGYALRQTERSFTDVFVGARYFGVDVSARWNLTAAITTPGGETLLPAEGSIGRDVDLWDGIVGVRGQFGLGDSRWSVPYYADVGTGSSDLTWNAMSGLTREFGWGELMLVYRHLEYDEGSDGLLQGFSFSGPAIGARFSF